MKRGPVTGAIAGLVAGIVGVIFGIIGRSWGLVAFTPITLPVPPQPDPYIAVIMIVLTIIFGAIFGTIYSRFYNQIPGKRFSKGVYFGLMIWLIKDVAAGAYVALVMGSPLIASSLIFPGFFMWIVFGLVMDVNPTPLP